MKLIQPAAITDAALISSSVPENDRPEWSAATTYALGAMVMKAATHRLYESVVADNLANDPADANGAWIDAGPTNRWAMLVPTVGAVTSAAAPLAVRIAPGAAFDAVAVLDAVGATVRVQVLDGATILFDETRDTGRAVMSFFDLPGTAAAHVLITVAGSGTVSVGKVLIGPAMDLGETETSPTIGITDYSKRTTDDFGVTTVTPRNWAKTMTLRTKIDTDQVDAAERKVAAIRAVPALWIGDERFDSLSIYGFFKSFQIDLALETISYVSLSIEGLAA